MLLYILECEESHPRIPWANCQNQAGHIPHSFVVSRSLNAFASRSRFTRALLLSRLYFSVGGKPTALPLYNGNEAEDKDENRDHEDGTRDGSGEEEEEIPLEIDHGLGKGAFHQLPQHEGEDKGRERDVDLLENVADDAGNDHDAHLEEAAADGIRADDRNGDDGGIHDGLRHLGNFSPQPCQRQVEDEEHHIPDVHAGDDAPDEIGIALEQGGTGRQSVHDEGSEQNRHRGGCGYAHGEEGDHGGA